MACRTSAVLVLALGLLSGACGSDATGPPEGDLDELRAAEQDRHPPYGPGAEVGREYHYELYVHCGVEWALIDGEWWTTPLLSDGHRNPPDGWGNPVDSGTLVLLDGDTAEYAGGPDATVVFRRGDGTARPDPCR